MKLKKNYPSLFREHVKTTGEPNVGTQNHQYYTIYYILYTVYLLLAHSVCERNMNFLKFKTGDIYRVLISP